MTRHRYIAVAEWEACALMDGSMTQKRVPASLWRVPPRVGALIWVQEPFIYYGGKGHDKYVEGVGYRADAGPAGGFPPPPEHLRNRNTTVQVQPASAMRAVSSRLTLEITRVWKRDRSFWEVGERQHEGFRALRHANSIDTLMSEAFAHYWHRAYPGVPVLAPVLMLQFTVHRANISLVSAALAGKAA